MPRVYRKSDEAQNKWLRGVFEHRFKRKVRIKMDGGKGSSG
jgi:hypothetical protein